MIDIFLERRSDFATHTDSDSDTTSEYEDVPDRDGNLRLAEKQEERGEVEEQRRELDLCPQGNILAGGPTGTFLRRHTNKKHPERSPSG